MNEFLDIYIIFSIEQYIIVFIYMVVDSIFVGDSHKFLAHVEL